MSTPNTVTVVTRWGKHIEVQASADETIADLKRKIAEATAGDADSQAVDAFQLMRKDPSAKIMVDNEPIGAADAIAVPVYHVVVRMRTG